MLQNDGCVNQMLVLKCTILKFLMFNLCSHLKQTDFRRRWCSGASEPGGGDGGGRCLSVCLSACIWLNSAGMRQRNQVGFHEQVSLVFLLRVSHTVSPPVLISSFSPSSFSQLPQSSPPPLRGAFPFCERKPCAHTLVVPAGETVLKC